MPIKCNYETSMFVMKEKKHVPFLGSSKPKIEEGHVVDCP